MKPQHLLSLLLALGALATPPAGAGEGHDHGPALVAAGPALPRFAVSSDFFELVGVVNGKLLTVYLDRFADNAPVSGAQIDMELGGAKLALKEVAAGEFEATLAQAVQPGITPVTATVVAGNENDLLAADLVVHAEQTPALATASGWRRYAPWGAGAVVAALAALWLGRLARRTPRAGGAA